MLLQLFEFAKTVEAKSSNLTRGKALYKDT